MIVNADAKALEWYAGTFLSQDQVAIAEIWDKVDQHTSNQTAFNLPSRLVAKKFVFRLVYGGSAYSYALDPDFEDVGYSQKRWQEVIDSFYSKYKGWHKWHISLMNEVTRTGKLVMPTGREYLYTPKKRRGILEWPRTTILNYPVQGFGADIMMLARISFRKRFHENRIEGTIISSVHDSIVCDVPSYEVQRTADLFYEVFDDLPKIVSAAFDIDFNLPLLCEVSQGFNMKELEEIQRS